MAFDSHIHIADVTPLSWKGTNSENPTQAARARQLLTGSKARRNKDGGALQRPYPENAHS